MAIKGHKAADAVSVYDPKVKAYREVLIADLEAELLALGFTKAQVAERIRAITKAKEG